MKVSRSVSDELHAAGDRGRFVGRRGSRIGVAIDLVIGFGDDLEKALKGETGRRDLERRVIVKAGATLRHGHETQGRDEQKVFEQFHWILPGFWLATRQRAAPCRQPALSL